MTTYRLPDWLGGHEVYVCGTRGDGQLIVRPRGIVPTGVNPTEIHIDRDELTEVKPPLPPEPKPWATVSDSHGKVWQLIGKEPAPWRCTDGRTTCWEVLNGTALGPVNRLIVDPADDAPGMTVLHLSDPRDTLKMLRETLCVAQLVVGDLHRDRIQRMIDEIDRQRPLGADGKHGNGFRCTPTCGCEPQAGRGEVQP